MLEDIYLEYLIKKKKDGKQKAIIALVVFGGCIVSAALLMLTYVAALSLAGTQLGSFAFSIGLVLIALAWYGVYLLIGMQNIEYEYILTNSEIDIDKVMSKKGRKHMVSFDFRNIDICANINDSEHNHEYKNTVPENVYTLAGDINGGNVYFTDYCDEDGKRTRVVFQPTYKMIQAIKKFNPRKVFAAEE